MRRREIRHHARRLAERLLAVISSCLRLEEQADCRAEFMDILEIGLEDCLRAEAAWGRRSTNPEDDHDDGGAKGGDGGTPGPHRSPA